MMKRQLLLAAGIAVLTAVSTAGETVKFDKPTDWTPQKNVTVSADGLIEFTGGRTEIHSTPFAVDPNKKYVFTAEIRCKPDTAPGRAFAGNWSLTSEKFKMLPQHVMAVRNTDSKLLEPAVHGSKKIVIAKPAGWQDNFQKLHWGVVFNSQSDLSDLPNLSYNDISAAELDGDRLQLTLRFPLKKSYPADTPTRFNSSGNGMYGGWSYRPAPAEWTPIQWTVSGQAASGNPNNKWWPTTEFGAVRIIANYNNEKNSALQVRNVVMNVLD